MEDKMDLRKITTLKLSKLIGILVLSLMFVCNNVYSKSNDMTKQAREKGLQKTFSTEWNRSTLV